MNLAESTIEVSEERPGEHLRSALALGSNASHERESLLTIGDQDYWWRLGQDVFECDALRKRHTPESGLEGDIGEHGFTWQRGGVVGKPVEVDPRCATAVLVEPRNGHGLVEAMHAQCEHPERIALLPLEPRLGVIARPDQLGVKRRQLLGLRERRHADEIGPALDPDRFTHRRAGAELDRVPVRRLEQLGTLVLRSRVQPQPVGAQPEVAAIFPQATLAHVDDLLALEEGAHDHRPLLERRYRHSSQDRRRMDETITSDGLRLAAHFASPASGSGSVPGLVLCHGFPRGPRGAASSAATYLELADRVAREAGWAALAFNFRGTGTSEGDFSIAGWRADLRTAIRALRERASGVWVAGMAEGGAFALCEGAPDPAVGGVATLAAPASFQEWARNPNRLLEHARRVGMVRTPGFPSDVGAWGREVGALDPLACARMLGPRPLLVLHGTDDGVIAPTDARALCDAAGPSAELRLVHAAGHRLRHDPRAVAALLGWLARQMP